MQVSKIGFKINHLLGSSSTNIQHISYSNDCLIYLCGCYVVFYNPILDEQVNYIKHSSDRISCIAASGNHYIAIGQDSKHPLITIYDISNMIQTPILLYQLKGHKHTIDQIHFSPNGKYIVSICNKDGSMFIWQNGQRISQNKIIKGINRVIFDNDGDLITVGRGNLKIWKFKNGEIVRKMEEEYWMIEGKNIALGRKFSTKDIIDVAIYKGKIVALTSDGLLCIIDKEDEKIEKWIDLMMDNTTSIQVYGDLALCSGDNSIVKVISLVKLTLFAKFPKPPPHLRQNITKDEPIQYKDNEHFPNCLGVRILGEFISTLYENRTIFIWKIIGNDITAIRSIISHQNRISSISLLQQIKDRDILFFSTASDDNTLRIWHYYKKEYNNRQSIDIAQILGIKRNVYCRNLTRIIYSQSENPIHHLKMYGTKNIVCISSQQLLIYSLDGFQLINNQSFQDVIQSIDTFSELIYIGFINGSMKVYKLINDDLIKMKDIQFQDSVNHIKAYNQDLTIISFKDKLIIYSLNRSEIIFQEKAINSWTLSNHNIIYSATTFINIYNINKKKKINVNIQHEIQQQQVPVLIRSNSWLIVILTNANKLILANLSVTILHSQVIHQSVNDLELTQNGEVIFVTQHGTIGIFKIDCDSKYEKVQSRVKKWFQQNDLSWIDNSIWKSNNAKSQNINSSKLLRSIEQSESMRLGEEFPKKQLPNVEINYRRGDTNQMSVFNPSSIANQANKIYQNIEGIIKNQSKKNKEIQGLDVLQLEQSKKKKKIFATKSNHHQKITSPPLLVGNLVNSTYQSPQNYNVQTQKNVNHNVQQFNLMNFDENKQLNLKKMQQSLNSQQYCNENKQILHQIYKKLKLYFKEEQQRQIVLKFKQMSNDYLNFLEKQFRK